MGFSLETGMVHGHLRAFAHSLQAFADGRWQISGTDYQGRRFVGHLEAVRAENSTLEVVMTLSDPADVAIVKAGSPILLQTGMPSDEEALQAARDRAVERTLFDAQQVAEFEQTYGITWAALELDRLLNEAAFHQIPVSDRERVDPADYHALY